MKTDDDHGRTLTDADIDAIIVAFTNRFLQDLGRGLWRVMITTVMALLLLVAAWGAVKGGLVDLQHQIPPNP